MEGPGARHGSMVETHPRERLTEANHVGKKGGVFKIPVYTCLCVCVIEREKERERGHGR